MATMGYKVVGVAEKYIGVTEKPPASNRGPYIDDWQAYWGLNGKPYCGMATSAWYREAGVKSNVPHPAVHQMVVNARANGELWNGTGKIPAGALWMQDWVHTGVVTEHLVSSNEVRIIDGNSNNSVRRTTRRLTGSDIFVAIPKDILREDPDSVPVLKYEWYLRDRYAKPFVFRNAAGKVGWWDSKAKADKAINNLLTGPQSNYWALLQPRSTTTYIAGQNNGKKVHVIQLGDVKLYGPWKTNKQAVLNAKASLEKRIGRSLELIERPYL